MNKVLGLILMFPLLALAADDVFTIQIKNHRFEPAELTVPAGKKVKLLVENLDASPEEFESHELNREKIISGNSKATIYIGPLAAGKYPFFGEFNEATAQGVIIAK
jgi:plastocyanin